MEYIKSFISAIIPDIKHPVLNNDGSKGLGGHMIDDSLAYGYYSNLKSILKDYTVTINLYGGAYTKKIQVLDIDEFGKYLTDFKHNPDLEKLSSITSHLCGEAAGGVKGEGEYNPLYLVEATSIFTQHIDIYLKGNIIGDDFFQLLLQLLNYVDVFEIEYQGRKEFVFVKKQQKQVQTTRIEINPKIHSQSSSKKEFDILLHKPVNQLTQSEFRYNNVMLLVKEVRDGYVDMRKHSLALKNKRGKYELHEYKIGEDITIVIDESTQSIISIDKHETIYETIKDEDGIWKVRTPENKLIPTDEFEYYKVEEQRGSDPKKNITTIRLYGAYTHVLRDILGFKPQTWQYKFLINQKRINYVAGVRRGGKTLLSSYLIIRFLYRQPSSRKHILRQPKGIYAITSKDKFKAVLDYIEAQSQRIKVLRSLVYVKKQDRLILSDDKLDFANNKYLDVQSTYDFVSAKGYKTGVGNGGDDIIMDESSTISEDVWLNLAPIVTNEGANLFCISTINWETPKQWFYSNLVNTERQKLPDTYSQRVTIDDIDDNIMDETAKAHAKSILAHNMARYLGELYATFSSESQVFSSEGSIILENPKDTPTEIIIGYDPAKRSDFGAIVVGAIINKVLYLIEEYQLQGDYSNYQKGVLFEIKEKYINDNFKTTLIMDGTSSGDVVAEILGNIVDYKVWYTGDNNSNYKPVVDAFGSWKVSKTRLVTITQLYFETKKIKINSSLTNLQSEIQVFKSYAGQNGKIRYDAISGEHDDLVNAMMLICFYHGYIEGAMGHLSKDNDIEYRKMFQSYINHKTNRYDEYFETIRSKVQRKSYEARKFSQAQANKTQTGYNF